jgi:hypothetical protein
MFEYFYLITSIVLFGFILYLFKLVYSRNTLETIYENNIDSNNMNIEILNYGNLYDLHIYNLDKKNIEYLLKYIKIDEESIKILQNNNLLEKMD